MTKMTKNLEELFQRIQSFEKKIEIISDKKCNPYWNRNEETIAFLENYFEILMNCLSEEIRWFSQMFQISEKCALILIGILSEYINGGGVRSNFVSSENLRASLTLDVFEFYQLREAIFDLQNLEIITIEDVDYVLVRVIYKIDRKFNDYYMIPKKESFVPFANKKFELTKSFIQKLNHL